MQLSTATIEPVSKIPLREIAETKRTLCPAHIDYEILVEAECVWQCLAQCAAAFAQSGLTCKTLRYGAQGRVFFRLQDDGSADLERLHDLLAAATGVAITSWSTVIGFERRPRPGPGDTRPAAR